MSQIDEPIANAAKKVQLCNKLAGFGFVVSLCLAVFQTAVPSSGVPLSFVWALAGGWLLVPILYQLRHIYLSRLYFVSYLTGVLTLGACYLGGGQHLHCALYPLVTLGLVLFEPKDRLAITYSALLPMTAFFALQVTDFNLFSFMSERVSEKPFFLYDLFVFAIVFAIVAYFFKGFDSLIARLEESQTGLDEAQRLAGIGSWDWSVGHKHVQLSETCQELIFGRTQLDPFSTRDLLSQLPDTDRMFVFRTLGHLKTKRETREGEIRLRRDGSIRTYFFRAEPLRNAKGELQHIHGILQDITELREAERKIEEQRAHIVTTSKMSSLGEMAGGVAHEINTPLAVIQLSAKQLRRALTSGPLGIEASLNKSRTVEKMVEQISKIIQGLTAFARGGDEDPLESTSLKKVLDGALVLATSRFDSHGIELHIGQISENDYIKCRGTQIGQALLNLLNNSFDAVLDTPEKWVAIDIIKNSARIHIIVTDSGQGIPLRFRERIMEPFFTTKEIGRGTGLGLSIAKGILENHGGKLILDTESKRTRFVIDLPLDIKADVWSAS